MKLRQCGLADRVAVEQLGQVSSGAAAVAHGLLLRAATWRLPPRPVEGEGSSLAAS